MTTGELRAKFEEWYPDAIGDVQPFECYMKGYASRDAEIEALRKRINNAPVYYVPVEKPIDEDGWVQVIGSVKALNNMRGKHVRLVIDEAIDAAMQEDRK